MRAAEEMSVINLSDALRYEELSLVEELQRSGTEPKMKPLLYENPNFWTGNRVLTSGTRTSNCRHEIH